MEEQVDYIMRTLHSLEYLNGLRVERDLIGTSQNTSQEFMNDSGIINTYSNRRNEVFHRHQGSKTIVQEEPSLEDYEDEEDKYQHR